MQTKLYALGDSITYGFPYGPHLSWPHMVSQRTGLSILNGGLNGDTTSFMLHRLAEAFSFKPTHIIWLGGTNDAYWGQPIVVVGGNAVEIYRRCREQNVQLIIGLPIPVDEPQVEALLAGYRDFYCDLAVRESIPVIPFHQAFIAPDGRFRSELTTDGCHPNIDGYEAMAEVLEEILPEIVSDKK
jgi:acyl-CoA thioesterase I